MYKVMIVEDEEFIMQGICLIVDWEKLGLEVVHKAQDGTEAIDLWEQEKVDIIITDICMPQMGGLELLKKIREQSEQVRFIILSGYDQFEYARQAITLDVEDYILKPIDEEKLMQVLEDTVSKIQSLNKKKNYSIDELRKAGCLLKEPWDPEKAAIHMKELELALYQPCFAFATMKYKISTLKEDELASIYNYLVTEYKGDNMKVLFTEKDELLLLISWEEVGKKNPLAYFKKLQNQLEEKFDKPAFITVGPVLSQMQDLAKAYRHTRKLQRYLIIEGYGSCIDESYVCNRMHEDIDFDEDKLYNLIIHKDKEGAAAYLEDLIVNNITMEKYSIEVIDTTLVRVMILLQKIKDEFGIESASHQFYVTELLEEIYHADDISIIKGAIIVEMVELIELLQIENSQYSPVVKQIMAKVKNDYREDMSLKTLAGKYRMNPSYLGQIFLREVGCTFSQYLNNTRIKVARELILKTNMRMHDISNEIGYVDISYFYRMFRKYYGISPASLREIKSTTEEINTWQEVNQIEK
ncbi:response regulator [Anaeromicropila populeti]|uniref:Stage 0 sporulation protein A homolog n=1 Tax=Anaeromicropila populeti TaxID=37658 RepID=A0A1I6IFW0_9FIRM|nr:response regulator [Anaeromicropila populeti]SFR65677.1 two-component system, response regulator YesN [Anaeromicropila populeti]